MGMRETGDWQAILEPVPVTEVFATSVEYIDEGDVWRVVVFHDRHASGIGGPTERIIVARLVVPKAAFDKMVHGAIRAMQGKRTN